MASVSNRDNVGTTAANNYVNVVLKKKTCKTILSEQFTIKVNAMCSLVHGDIVLCPEEIVL